MSRHGFLWVYRVWLLLIFTNMQICLSPSLESFQPLFLQIFFLHYTLAILLPNQRRPHPPAIAICASQNLHSRILRPHPQYSDIAIHIASKFEQVWIHPSFHQSGIACMYRKERKTCSPLHLSSSWILAAQEPGRAIFRSFSQVRQVVGEKSCGRHTVALLCPVFHRKFRLVH